MEVRKGSGGPPRGAREIGMPSRKSLRGQEALPKVLKGSVGSPRRPERIGRISWKSVRGQEAIPKVR